MRHGVRQRRRALLARVVPSAGLRAVPVRWVPPVVLPPAPHVRGAPVPHAGAAIADRDPVPDLRRVVPRVRWAAGGRDRQRAPAHPGVRSAPRQRRLDGPAPGLLRVGLQGAGDDVRLRGLRQARLRQAPVPGRPSVCAPELDRRAGHADLPRHVNLYTAGVSPS
ncbi:hypothetical protein PBRA_003504 [Plasmodiophora brassicae]|uniref:Uncharacterized protein n=1 Tax=Plasmodiophora brassicae TaxID=37360 RepID=A0A0G4J8P0_PLABS|nr:hypothetical protein PBRA_003504 [Plasmodiophora brassicae]